MKWHCARKSWLIRTFLSFLPNLSTMVLLTLFSRFFFHTSTSSDFVIISENSSLNFRWNFQFGEVFCFFVLVPVRRWLTNSAQLCFTRCDLFIKLRTTSIVLLKVIILEQFFVNLTSADYKRKTVRLRKLLLPNVPLSFRGKITQPWKRK